MHVAIVGGGINGVMTAWLAARAGHQVTLFERGVLLGETSSASSKLLHGGLRYLANAEFRLVREALKERAWWLREAPELTTSVAMILPVLHGARPRWILALGLWLYVLLSRGDLPRHRWLGREALLQRRPDLRSPGLRGGYVFFDGLMHDDAALGRWAAQRARESGAVLHEYSPVDAVRADGSVQRHGEWLRFDRVINVAGPWAAQLLAQSGIDARHELDLVRGSHVVFDQPCTHALLLQDPESSRILFVLPYQGQTLFGTTEVRQSLDQACVPSDVELAYLRRIWVFHFGVKMPEPVHSFAGCRPLIRDVGEPGAISREYALERQDKLISVFGGKWTTSRALAARVLESLA